MTDKIVFYDHSTDEVFWEQVLIAATRLGNSPLDAIKKADILLRELRDRRIDRE